MKKGILLINLGSPAAPTPAAVGTYLREFLMDGKVLDIPAPLRWFLVNVIIVPRRRFQSAKLYRTIWTDAGSPLLVNTESLAARLREVRGVDCPVEIGMRYGQPSIEAGLARLLDAGVERVHAVPLYPQYAESSYETAVIALREAAARLGCQDRLELVPPFYDRPEYLEAEAANIGEQLAAFRPDHVLFSYHSLPVRHLERLDRSGGHCLKSADCCESVTEVNRLCYRAHCLATTRGIAARLGLAKGDYSVGFQSRLGRAAWVGPTTEDVLAALGQRGVQRLAVCCPSFVADCLETLEEIGERGSETFLEAGGKEYRLITAMNDHQVWVRALSELIG
jgi:ferrochelatase